MPGPWTTTLIFPGHNGGFGGGPNCWLFWNTCAGPRRTCPRCFCVLCVWHCQLCFLQKGLGIRHDGRRKKRGTRGKGRKVHYAKSTPEGGGKRTPNST
uniref:Protein Tat n=1 Tax=Jembrana disease virus TaxID=36370 RepID=B0YNA5_JEMBR|nr:Tat1 [Jembrana disease virus]